MDAIWRTGAVAGESGELACERRRWREHRERGSMRGGNTQTATNIVTKDALRCREHLGTGPASLFGESGVPRLVTTTIVD